MQLVFFISEFTGIHLAFLVLTAENVNRKMNRWQCSTTLLGPHLYWALSMPPRGQNSEARLMIDGTEASVEQSLWFEKEEWKHRSVSKLCSLEAHGICISKSFIFKPADFEAWVTFVNRHEDKVGICQTLSPPLSHSISKVSMPFLQHWTTLINYFNEGFICSKNFKCLV